MVLVEITQNYEKPDENQITNSPVIKKLFYVALRFIRNNLNILELTLC